MVISSDITRKTLAGISPTRHRPEQFGEGIYSPEFTEKTYEAMFQQAKQFISSGEPVILDATFGTRKQRSSAYELAKYLDADFLLVECRLDEEGIIARLKYRQAEGISTSDADAAVYENEKKVFEPVVELPAKEHIAVDAALPLDEQARAVSVKLNLFR